jgi:Cupin-like domain
VLEADLHPLDNVPRIAPPDRATLMAKYAKRGEPVVIRGLLADTAIDRIRTREAASKAFGAQSLTFGPEYGIYVMTSLMHGPAPPESPRRITVAMDDYWRAIDAEPDSPMMCVEDQTPPSVAELAPPPAVCADDADMRSTVFVGNAGNVAPFHFDGDCRHVLLHQVYGRKLVIMLPPRAASALRPIANFATLYLRGLDPGFRRELVSAVGGWEVVIEPGETILMPALVWHGVVYLEHGMSVNYRFGRRPQHAFASEHLHLDGASQRFVAATLSDEGWQRHAASWNRLLEAWSPPTKTALQKYQQVDALLAELVAGLGDEPELPPISDERYVPIPAAARQALLRAHLFDNRLYLHRQACDIAPYAAAL